MKKLRKKTILICLDCEKEIIGGAHLSRHVQKEHGYSSYDEYKIKYNLIKTNDILLCEGAITCNLCGLISHDLTSHITRKHKIKINEYKQKYGDIRSDRYLTDQSERITGDKNPAYNHGGKFSPLSDNFIYADKINKEEIKNKISKSNKDNGNNDATMSYWLNAGYTEDESKQKIKERQTTFTLRKCIEKYGEEEGKSRWLDRQEKWQNSCKKTRKNGFSKISQKLFWQIYEKLNKKNSIFFAELGEDKLLDDSGLNNEYRLKLTTRILLPDFIDLNTKKIIEFDGTYWHGEHKIKYTNKLRDEDRDKLLESEGYKILHIKECEYRKDSNLIINKCLEFLNE
jgi:very-short-patch-repair endonuclease